MTAEAAANCLWAAWYVTWWLPALWTQRPASRPKRGGQMADRALAGIGALLLFLPPVLRRPSTFWPFAPLWSESMVASWALFLCILASFAFCWWARLHLGRLWSGLVTVKQDHHVVDTGPYRLVRHPIYTGVIAAALFLGLIKATPLALGGACALTFGFYLTARKEETFLRQELGAADYDAYSRRTPMLLPLPRPGSR